MVVPLYNEEDNVSPLCRSVREALADWPGIWEMVIVDDGSRDQTVARLTQEARDDPRIRIVVLQRNAGQTLAMATGFARARGRVIVSMDGDLQNDPRDIPMLLSRIESGFDVVCGWRKDRQDPWLSRKLPSRIANAIISRLTGIPIHDNGCSLKAYRAEVIRSLNLYSEMHRFLPALSSMTGARIDEVVVRHHARRFGTSKYGISRTFKVVGDMVTIKMLTQFATRPGEWFARLSLPWLLLGLVSGVLWLGHLSFGRSPSIVFPGVAVLFLYLSAHFLSLSVLSEMLLAHADRRDLRRLIEVLSACETLPQASRA